MSDRRAPAGTAAVLALLVALAGCSSAGGGRTAPSVTSVRVDAASQSSVTVAVAAATTTLSVTSVPTPTVTAAAPAVTVATAAPAPSAATTLAPPTLPPPTTLPPTVSAAPPTTVADNGPRMVIVVLASHPSGYECPLVGSITMLQFTWQSAGAAQVVVRWADGTLLASGPPASSFTVPHTCAAMPTLYRFYPVAADGTVGPPWNLNV